MTTIDQLKQKLAELETAREQAAADMQEAYNALFDGSGIVQVMVAKAEVGEFSHYTNHYGYEVLGHVSVDGLEMFEDCREELAYYLAEACLVREIDYYHGYISVGLGPQIIVTPENDIYDQDSGNRIAENVPDEELVETINGWTDQHGYFPAAFRENERTNEVYPIDLRG